MGIESSVIVGQLFSVDGQDQDGFTVVVHDDLEFGGSYNFTEAYTQIEAHEMIFAGDAVNDEDGLVN